MKIRQITQAQAWDRALLALPQPHVLQSWAWGELKSRHGWTAHRLLWEEDGVPVAAASVLQRRLPGLPVSILYVPRGPLLDWTDAHRPALVLAELEQLGRRQRALFVKIDPDVYYPEAAPAFAGRPGNARDLAQRLEARGWCFSGDQIQFRNTALLDLDRPEDEILAAMKSKTRYNVRLAGRRGVVVQAGTTADLDTFYRLYETTARRDGFAIRPPGYYHDAWGRFLQAGLGHLFLAEFEGETVAGLLLFAFGATAWYMYGASSNRHRKQMPNYLLQWQAICRARALGCRVYDLWGAPDRLDESDPMWGVYRFKLGLGGELARGVGAWDYPVRKLGYRLYTEIVPRYLAWLRNRGQTEDESSV